MFIINLFRRLFGYVTFCASGGFGERFINLCATQGIYIRNIEVNENSIIADTKIKNYKKLRHIAKKSGMKIKAVHKYGMPFFINRHKNRIGLVIGAAFFVIFMSTMSLFIWNIETTGGEKISSDEILQTVYDLGLKRGALSSDIDESEVVRLAMMKLSGKLSWMAVNIKGCRAVVEVRDYEPKPEDETYTEPSNIVADFDGLILSMDIYNGKKANYEGNGVEKGDLLISGIIENRDTSSQFLEARGEILALHNDTYQTKTAAKAEIKQYQKINTVKVLNFFFLKIPLGFFSGEDNYDEYTSEKYLNYGSFELPFGITAKTRAYYEVKENTYPNLSSIAFDEYTCETYEKYKNTLITSSKIKVSMKNNMLSVSGNNECIDFMGEKQKIEMQQ
ncbi:MAG: sporulation protein YqfD [Faecalibacterium sp.]|nr:sporulation protein YqfD [Ruminococcus sp.]MCM1391634.1 sporulation protein YqfD [Ruminococcus sp.]MCM1485757.1 sporulation protein YqfD [Faecalibacterium sp.]